ncbi:MAG: PD40 domain-containing protein [Sandaracinaceae bacterium]|nr:PD40 domain-containing protein [Sandaracinaceae bacterium]
MRVALHASMCASILVSTLAAGCGTSTVAGTCGTSADCPADQMCVDSMCRPRSSFDAGPGRPDAPAPSVVSIAITPADPVVTTDGTPQSVDFGLEATLSDGTTSTIASAFWSASSRRLGAIDGTTGVFTIDGDLGGVVTVQAEALGMMATTTLTVNLTRVVIGDGAPADAADRFTTLIDDPARRANVLYPLEGTLMPQNVYPPDVQWEGGDAGDLYRVTLTTPRATLTGYVVHSGPGFGFHWAIGRDVWRALADSSGGEHATLTLDRWIAASSEAVRGETRNFDFASASITGSIYYWDLAGGRILRIRGDGSGLERFMPSPPVRGAGERCVACHAISRDGRRMAAEIWDASNGFGAVYDLTLDLTGDPPPAIVQPSSTRWLTSSFSPDASRLIANWGNEIFLVDGNTGARLPTTGTPLPTTGGAQPEWSPDGNSIAYIRHNGAGWGVDFTASDLAVIPVTGADAFGDSTTIFPGAGRAVARPSWSPDSRWIAVQYGVNSRSNNSGTQYPASIRLVNVDGTVIDLPALNGGAENSYYPTFSPFDEGGYFWLAFFSARDYGNAQVGTRGTGRRQLWVSAIANSPTAGSDPSRAPYWLPQQDVTHQNMAAFWAEEACRADGRECNSSGECCSGFCRDVGAGPVCVPPNIPECSMTGESCRTDADCCEGAGGCASNVCTILG